MDPYIYNVEIHQNRHDIDNLINFNSPGNGYSQITWRVDSRLFKDKTKLIFKLTYALPGTTNRPLKLSTENSNGDDHLLGIFIIEPVIEKQSAWTEYSFETLSINIENLNFELEYISLWTENDGPNVVSLEIFEDYKGG